MADHLYQTLKSTLVEKEIPFLSSHTICPPDDPRSFLIDGHFMPEKDAELAQAMIEITEKEKKKQLK